MTPDGLGLLALILATAFAAAAFYINFVEHPARMRLPAEQAIAQWAPSYARAYNLQASLAVLSGLSGIAAWWIGGTALFLAGGLTILANWPWTLVMIAPVNARLEALVGSDEAAQAGPLLDRWAKLHAVRTALGFAATAIFATALVGAA